MSRVLVLLGATCCAVAGWWVLRPTPADHPDRIAPLFALIDLDGDGAVDPDEARSVGALELDFAALDLDHRLGFTGGTDSHDARPGSTDDGPGPVGYWAQITGNPEPLAGYAPGALTGAWVTGELTSDSLFDALEGRATVATTGPRPSELAVWIADAGGTTWAPGSELDAGAGPFTLHVQGLDAEVEVIGRDGVVMTGGVATDATWSWSWTPGAGDWVYLRLRIGIGEDEERMWASPWWAD